MPWPDFTELTFGFAFLRELEQNYVHGGRFPKAPDFISQGAEATKGYDVEVAIDGSTSHRCALYPPAFSCATFLLTL